MTGEKAAASEKDFRARLRDGYERFAERISTELRERRKVGKKQWEDTISSARDFLKRTKPELKRDEIEKVLEGFRKDVRHALRTIRERGDKFTRSESFLTARDRGAEFVLKIVARVKDAAESLETNLTDILKYRKGDVVGGGNFLCTKCQEPLSLASGPIPACAKCGGEEFTRKA